MSTSTSEKTVLENIFSIKDTDVKDCKIITFLGREFKHKRIRLINKYNKFSFFGLRYHLERKMGQKLYKDQIAKNSDVKILIYLHLFYESSWKVISEYLKNLEPYNYDLIVTCTEDFYSEKLLNKIRKFKPDADISVYPNYGFDVGPFIDKLNNIDLEKYDIVYKLHSKGVNRPFIFIYNQIFKHEDWFFNLFNGCLGAKSVHEAIDKIYNSENVGIVAAENLIISDPKHKQVFTGEFAKKYNVPINEKYQYVAGTCFAMRAKLLQPIKDLGLTIEDFSATKRGIFSLAHAMERLVCACIEPQGYSYYGIPVKHKEYKKEREYYQKYSASRLLDDDRFKIDEEYFYKRLELKLVEKYEVQNVKLKDIRRSWEGQHLTLEECHAYKYLQGDVQQYEEYCEYNQKWNFYMSKERFDALKTSIENNYDPKNMPILLNNYVISDGQHRLCVLYNLYGGEYEVPCLVITYIPVQRLSTAEKIFSLTNTPDRRYKVVTILGKSFMFERNKRSE